MNQELNVFKIARREVQLILINGHLDKTYISLISDLVATIARSGLQHSKIIYSSNDGENGEKMKNLITLWETIYQLVTKEPLINHSHTDVMEASLRAIKIAMYSFPELKKDNETSKG